MSAPDPFLELLQRVRSGDEQAVREFVTLYTPYIRRAVRAQLTRLNLRSAADSDDLCQSVLGSFLIRMAAGEYDLANAEDLHRLLGAIAQNKLIDLARRENAQRRDHRRVTHQSDGSGVQAGPDAEPSLRVAASDLLEAIQSRLTEEERDLFHARQAGHTWEQIAATGSDSASALRQRLSRALRRVAIELGLESAEE